MDVAWLLLSQQLKQISMEQRATGKPAGFAEREGQLNANSGKPYHNFEKNNFSADAGKEANFEGRG